MTTDTPAAHVYPYSHPSLIREHRIVLRLFTIILVNRGMPKERARREADSLLRLPPAKQPHGSAKAG
jgi:hypothetical protein